MDTSERNRLELFIQRIDRKIENWFDGEQTDPSPLEVYLVIREKLLKRIWELDKIKDTKRFWSSYSDPLDRIREKLKEYFNQSV